MYLVWTLCRLVGLWQFCQWVPQFSLYLTLSQYHLQIHCFELLLPYYPRNITLTYLYLYNLQSHNIYIYVLSHSIYIYVLSHSIYIYVLSHTIYIYVLSHTIYIYIIFSHIISIFMLCHIPSIFMLCHIISIFILCHISSTLVFCHILSTFILCHITHTTYNSIVLNCIDLHNMTHYIHCRITNLYTVRE